MTPHSPGLSGAARSFKGRGPHHDEGLSLVSLSDVNEIELLILKRMRELTMGDHRSMAPGSGFDFVGLRDWQAGDRPSAIDWPQSTLTNFMPLVVREFDQASTASVVIVADGSGSTRCAINGIPIAAGVARAIATIGMSAVFFQDRLGLLTFDTDLQHLLGVRPRIGRGQVLHCLDAYEHQGGSEDVKAAGSLSATISSFIRRTAMIPFVSDFLFGDPATVLHELAALNSIHDVFIVLIDAAFAFQLPPTSAGWIDAFDVETGRSRIMSRAALAGMADRVREWQDGVEQAAKAADIDLVRVGIDPEASDLALIGFVAERRSRRVS